MSVFVISFAGYPAWVQVALQLALAAFLLSGAGLAVCMLVEKLRGGRRS